jgi:hypothetical protein
MSKPTRIDHVAVADSLHRLLESTTLMRCVTKPLAPNIHGVVAFRASTSDAEVKRQVDHMDTNNIAPLAMVIAIVEPARMSVVTQNLGRDMALMVARLAEDAYVQAGGKLGKIRGSRNPFLVVTRLEGTP